ncbi:prolyl oligopeptidase family serine peptidase [Mesoterricola silvestris]|uniref:prolyl oligopeptidase n=1 Tax=Mesoterricola silvestris TaxID=2927979 RepID=A0AA48GVF6_9BACT|nr:prolyl oligopeptidase family serine peptidase [Mesoterricola silvestris]BDU71053.1 prolyl endopeptidase [Mesoterricola silvestris]
MRTFLSCLAATALVAAAPVPATRKCDQVDDYFGTKVADPYRWLEDDNAPETKAWVAAQNQATFAHLAAIPQRKAILERLRALQDYEKYSAPRKEGKNYFYSYNSGLQNQAVVYVTPDPAKAGKVLLDPNGLSKEGTMALAGMSPSPDGRLVAYAVAAAGSDWKTWKVRDVATGRDLPDELQWTKFANVAWNRKGTGFFYVAYAAPGQGEALKGVTKSPKVRFHAMGTPQADDTLVYERPDQPEWYLSPDVSDDGRWLTIHISKGDAPEQSVLLKDLRKPGAKMTPFLDRFDARYSPVGNKGDVFYFKTDKGAPRGRLVAIRAGHPDPKEWTELIPQAAGTDVLQNVSLVGGRFVATWMRDAHTAITFHSLKGARLGELALPGVGSASGFRGRIGDREAFYTYTSFNTPPAVYRYDFATGASTVLHAPKVAFDPAAYVVTQVFYPSKDGTKIPMFLVHRKGLVLDGTNPTLLYGYGGFDVSLTPSFSAPRVAWLEMGGVYAQPSLRGGGEYGKAWHDAGRLAHKQNVFDDFIAAGEWLIANRYTSTPRLAINGGSNGGLLVGACLTQRPDLWGAAVPEVGVMDMLRFHKFTVGWGWKGDYGSSETPEGFRTLIAYSPLHTIKAGAVYPPTLILTSDHDDRVVPAHSHKFTATLQAAQAGPAPILTRIATNAGHGAGKPTAKVLEEKADVYAFLVEALKVK